jgi:hypothetical protein
VRFQASGNSRAVTAVRTPERVGLEDKLGRMELPAIAIEDGARGGLARLVIDRGGPSAAPQGGDRDTPQRRDRARHAGVKYRVLACAAWRAIARCELAFLLTHGFA